jgi:hypothetical protein
MLVRISSDREDDGVVSWRAVAHSATAAAQWEQRGGCGRFTGTVRKWANARAFERH